MIFPLRCNSFATYFPNLIKYAPLDGHVISLGNLPQGFVLRRKIIVLVPVTGTKKEASGHQGYNHLPMNSWGSRFVVVLCYYYYHASYYYLLTVSHRVSLAGYLLWTTVASNSQESSCLCLCSTGIKGMQHHTLPRQLYFQIAPVFIPYCDLQILGVCLKSWRSDVFIR